MKNIAERTPYISSLLDLKQQIGDSLRHLRYENQNRTWLNYICNFCVEVCGKEILTVICKQ